MIIKRRKTRQIKVGNVRIGAGAPVSIQSMTKTDTRNVRETVCEIRRLQDAGCQIVRVAVKDASAAAAIAGIKKKIRLPLVADIHFDFRLALAAIRAGADKIRINPGNIYKRDEIEAVAKAAKKQGIPIRIGVNSGSVRKLKSRPLAETMVRAALDCAGLFESMKFGDIIISLKASDTATTVEAYREIASRCDYPLHLGITAAGLAQEGLVRSAIGIGSLLLDGIGDTIRVSLTADPVLEVEAARQILEAVGLASFGPQIISCPTCGRCQVDLVKIVEGLKDKLLKITSHGSRATSHEPSIKIAVMGCEVNGPGEATDADIGIAAGKGAGMLFKNGKPVKRVQEKDFVKELLKEMGKI